MRALALALALGVPALGCRPDLGDPVSIVTGPRILAVKGEPPEAKPGETATYRALVVSPAGTAEKPPLRWAFCASPLPLTENDAVSTACLGDGVRDLGGPSPTVDAATPLDACSLFGPDTPPGPFRPRDPDATGGFYQPVRAELDASTMGETPAITAFRLERVPCDLPAAPIAVAIQLAQSYQPNRNPTLAPLGASAAGAAIPLDAIPAGQRIQLATGWGAGDAETYVMFDPDTVSVVERREAMRVSWFVTGGSLADEVTGSAEDDPATTTGTTWLSPATPGVIHLWLVLRDSRGGVDYAAYELAVR
jgi:hypothetical protein